MGQDITLSKIPSTSEDLHVLSLNRSLTGMEILNFESQDDIETDDQFAEMLKKLFALGVEHISVYSNVLTLKCDRNVYTNIENEVIETVKNLYRFYN